MGLYIVTDSDDTVPACVQVLFSNSITTKLAYVRITLRTALTSYAVQSCRM